MRPPEMRLSSIAGPDGLQTRANGNRQFGLDDRGCATRNGLRAIEATLRVALNSLSGRIAPPLTGAALATV